MDAKLTLVCIVLLVFAVQDVVRAEFLFNRVLSKQVDFDWKCIPGRTVVKVQEKLIEPEENESTSNEDYDGRRSHMRFHTNDEFCKVCVCSVEGKDEYCSRRPARNVNECMMLATAMVGFKTNEPYDHHRSLSYMIRRDYIWHGEEIPSAPNAKCRRSHSYYSNSMFANDTDMDVGSDITSLLDYTDRSICFFCICTVSGNGAGCIPRNPWFCQYFRHIRDPEAARDRYRKLFEQDRPAYFRQMSYRLRRTMDDGMFDLVENGGDSLCCGHSDGHRRQLHHQVRTKIRMLKKKVNKENLMGGSPRDDYVDFIVNND